MERKRKEQIQISGVSVDQSWVEGGVSIRASIRAGLKAERRSELSVDQSWVEGGASIRAGFLDLWRRSSLSSLSQASIFGFLLCGLMMVIG
ncbi:hypothetical protein SO802_029429 [Lithocarpus litseifolius]|uniref:Uncharacterized protein n=1 Tax=Lithocarpus litseifolius TaxID=425828 RepID=A0AAW2BYT1_9ROSI